MKTKKKIAIVGAGYTGLLSGLIANDLGYPVDIYEAASHIGGILKDVEFNGSIFLSNCQYINANSKWLGLLGEARDCLYEFEHTYGSYCDLWTEVVSRDDVAGPVCPPNLSLMLSRLGGELSEDYSVGERFSLYPECIENVLRNYFQSFELDADDIHHTGLTGMQMSRLFLSGHVKLLQEFKSQSQIADQLYGLPRSLVGLSSLKALLPESGFGQFLDKLLGVIKGKNGISLYLSSPIKPSWDSGKLCLLCRGELHKYEKIIWACNPTPLVYTRNHVKLDSPCLDMGLLCADIDWSGRSRPLPFYIQVYSKEVPITRIFAYELDGKNKLSVECKWLGGHKGKVLREAQGISRRFGLDFNVRFESNIIRQKRHFLCTRSDYLRLNSLLCELKGTNVIHGGWHYYGRDQKIDAIAAQLECM